MPAALLHFSSLRRSQHNYVRAMPALKFQQNLRQNLEEHGIQDCFLWEMYALEVNHRSAPLVRHLCRKITAASRSPAKVKKVCDRTLEREFRRVLKDQNGTVSCADTQGRGSKMTRQSCADTHSSRRSEAPEWHRRAFFQPLGITKGQSYRRSRRLSLVPWIR